MPKARDQKQIYRLNETKSHWGLNPPPLAEWDTPNIALLGSIFVLIERYTKIILFSTQRVPWIAFLPASKANIDLYLLYSVCLHGYILF